MRQIALPFASEAALEAGSFFVSACNGQAHAWITRWPDWPGHALLLTGPEGSGKTHLSHIWQQTSHAARLTPERLAHSFTPALLHDARHAVLDDADAVPDPQALFHLLNWQRERGGSLLLTARRPAAAWGLALPDLRSRLNALPNAVLNAPDDALLSALLTKLFADRQLRVNPAVLDYLVRHMERSFAAAGRLAARLDEAALAENRAVTLPLARNVLENL